MSNAIYQVKSEEMKIKKHYLDFCFPKITMIPSYKIVCIRVEHIENDYPPCGALISLRNHSMGMLRKCFFPWFKSMAWISVFWFTFDILSLYLNFKHFAQSHWIIYIIVVRSVHYVFSYSSASMNHVSCVQLGVDRDVCVRRRRCCCSVFWFCVLCFLYICFDKRERKKVVKNRPPFHPSSQFKSNQISNQIFQCNTHNLFWFATIFCSISPSLLLCVIILVCLSNVNFTANFFVPIPSLSCTYLHIIWYGLVGETERIERQEMRKFNMCVHFERFFFFASLLQSYCNTRRQ